MYRTPLPFLPCIPTVVQTFSVLIKVKTASHSKIQCRYCTNMFCSVAIIFSILKIPGEWWIGWDAINKVSVTWPSAAINLYHLPVSPSLRFSLCFHISPSLPLHPTSSSSLSNSILLESQHMSPIIPSQPPHPIVFSFLSDFLSFPLSLTQLLLHLPQFDSSLDWCSYQSRKPSLVRDD